MNLALRSVLFGLALGAASCGHRARPETPRAPAFGAPAPASLAPSAASGEPSPAPVAPERATPKEVLPFVHDDFPRALAEAARTGRPLFVDAWAPWCHSCLSMRAYVLTDPRLSPLASRFVWLSVDTEKTENADFVRRYANEFWPTLWVLDPSRSEPILKWGGTATAEELVELLGLVDAGARAGLAQAEAFLRGNHAAARGEAAEAERAYRDALRACPPDRAGDRARIVEALVGVLASQGKARACASLALAEGPKLRIGTSRATALALGLGCARDAKETRLATSLADATERLIAERTDALAADDRSGLYEELIATYDALRSPRKSDVARAWVTFLEASAAAAPNATARAVFDAHRVSAYLALGEPARALPMLAASEREFPHDYNPPARLARVYLEMKRLDEAEAAIARAASRVYGPRSLRVFALAADIAAARGDKRGERSALERGLELTENVATTAKTDKLRAALAARLRALAP